MKSQISIVNALAAIAVIVLQNCSAWSPCSRNLARYDSKSQNPFQHSYLPSGDRSGTLTTSFQLKAESANTNNDYWEELGESTVDQDDDRQSDEDMEALLEPWDDRIARFNTVHLTGRVGNDPEARYFDNGNVVVNLSLGCKRKYHYMERKAKDIKYGEEETDWYGLEIWGPQAEYVSKFVEKGARVGVVGGLQIDKWSDKATGEPRIKAKVIVREFDVLESKAEAEMRRSNRRSPSFYTNDDSFDEYDPSRGSSGGFFDS